MNFLCSSKQANTYLHEFQVKTEDSVSIKKWKKANEPKSMKLSIMWLYFVLLHIVTATANSSFEPFPAFSTGSCGNCIFPFTTQASAYSYTEHHSCTTIDGDNPWCATQLLDDWLYVSGSGHYEYCVEPSCPGTSVSTTEQMSVHPANAPGNCCELNSMGL